MTDVKLTEEELKHIKIRSHMAESVCIDVVKKLLGHIAILDLTQCRHKRWIKTEFHPKVCEGCGLVDGDFQDYVDDRVPL